MQEISRGTYTAQPMNVSLWVDTDTDTDTDRPVVSEY